MNIMIVPIPYFDSDMAVNAYWLGSHDGEKILGIKDNFLRMDDVFFHFGLDVVEQIGIEAFTGGKQLFVPLSRMQLFSGPMERAHLNREQIVCVLPAECINTPEAVAHIQTLKEQGYTLALEGFPITIDPAALAPFTYVCLDYTEPLFNSWYAQAARLPVPLRPVVRGIPDQVAFRILKGNPSALFTGSFYSRPLTTKTKPKLSPIKVNALRLLSDINQEDFELDDIVKIIERDPYLSVSLLRFLNSAASGLSRKVNSIRQAVTILGQSSVRLWATIALSTILGEDRPNELTRLALIRAKFAEEVAGAFELGVFQPSLFIAGLFSLLDVMLEKPMEEALDEVAVNKAVRAAILGQESPMTPVMELIYAYEKGDWDQVSILQVQNNADREHISRAYLDALHWYRSLLKTIESTTDGEIPPKDAAQA